MQRPLCSPPPKKKQAIGTPISKLSLHTACGGVQPATTMPVVIDVGTDNEALLRSPLYVGVRHRRVRGDAYYQVGHHLGVEEAGLEGAVFCVAGDEPCRR